MNDMTDMTDTTQMTSQTTPQTIQLHSIAHARTGDKGNRSNICLFVYRPEDYALIVGQVTAERVAALFRHHRPTGVALYHLPLLHGMNIVIDDVLDGGVNSSLNLDLHGKSFSFLLLTLPIQVPASFSSPFQPPTETTRT